MGFALLNRAQFSLLDLTLNTDGEILILVILFLRVLLAICIFCLNIWTRSQGKGKNHPTLPWRWLMIFYGEHFVYTCIYIMIIILNYVLFDSLQNLISDLYIYLIFSFETKLLLQKSLFLCETFSAERLSLGVLHCY